MLKIGNQGRSLVWQGRPSSLFAGTKEKREEGLARQISRTGSLLILVMRSNYLSSPYSIVSSSVLMCHNFFWPNIIQPN